MGTGAYLLLLGGIFLFAVLLLQGLTYKKAKHCGIVKCCFALNLLQISMWLLLSIAVGAGFYYLTVRAMAQRDLPMNTGVTMAAILGGVLLCFGAAMLTGFGFLTKAGWFGFGMGSPVKVWAEETNGQIVFYRMERLAGGGEKSVRHLRFERSRENRERFACFLKNE